MKRTIVILTIALNLMALGPGTTSAENARHDFPYMSHYVDVLGSKMHYVDTGGMGDPIVMLHGQPTWSYLWRNIIPHLDDGRRVIALDLIGFGKSEKPDLDYTVEDHARYISAFMEALALDDMTLVIHDWGSFLGFNYATLHPERVKAIAFMESILPSLRGDAAPKDPENRAAAGRMIQYIIQVRQPDVGEKAIIEDNIFIEKVMPVGIKRTLSDDEHNAYRAPFEGDKNRRPMLQFPRQIVFDGKNPVYVATGMAAYVRHLTATPELPLLMLHASPGILGGKAQVGWVKQNLPNADIVYVGEGLHYVQEDQPDAIGQAIKAWMEKKGL